jgi:molybdopterin adenylyltransferase
VNAVFTHHHHVHTRAVVLTISDRCSRGEMVDLSGPAVVRLIEQSGLPTPVAEILPDELSEIAAALRRHAQGANLILTTGGTGLAPRDVTPQATLGAIDYEVPGIAEAMRAASLQVTPAGMLSRSVAGVRHGKLIVNLPGNPKAVRENLQAIAAALPHAISTLRGDVGEHSRPGG